MEGGGGTRGDQWDVSGVKSNQVFSSCLMSLHSTKVLVFKFKTPQWPDFEIFGSGRKQTSVCTVPDGAAKMCQHQGRGAGGKDLPMENKLCWKISCLFHCTMTSLQPAVPIYCKKVPYTCEKSQQFFFLLNVKKLFSGTKIKQAILQSYILDCTKSASVLLPIPNTKQQRYYQSCVCVCAHIRVCFNIYVLYI